MIDFDYVLVGGGLQNGLLALALQQQQPQAKVLLIESTANLGGNHTWCYHSADVPVGAYSLVNHLTVAKWPAYNTKFIDHQRTIPSDYSAITSERFAFVLREIFDLQGWSLLLQTRATEVSSHTVTLESGEVIRGRCVVDSRGPSLSLNGCGYQKFLGLEVELSDPWPNSLPMVMDATVPQTDGFHFVYCLPLSSHRVLVEDTYFSDKPTMNLDELRGNVNAYLAERSSHWTVRREESGVLPMPWQVTPEVTQPGALRGGYCGGWFHPATGYSFPVALRLAMAIAAVDPESASFAAEQLARKYQHRWQFGRFLNRLLFQLVPPYARWQIFARLYRTLPPAVLARFYAMEFTVADAIRIIVGRPPRIDMFRPFRLSGNQPWLALNQ